MDSELGYIQGLQKLWDRQKRKDTPFFVAARDVNISMILRGVLCDRRCDEPSRNAFVLALLAAVWQLSGACFSELPPSTLYLGGSEERDTFQQSMSRVLHGHIPEEGFQINRASDLKKIYEAEERLQRAAKFNRTLRTTELGGEEDLSEFFSQLYHIRRCSNLSIATHDIWGILTERDGRLLWWLGDSNQRDLFAKFVTTENAVALKYPVGVDVYGLVTRKVLSVSGSLPIGKHGNLANACVKNDIPALFLPHTNGPAWPDGACSYLRLLVEGFSEYFRPMKIRYGGYPISLPRRFGRCQELIRSMLHSLPAGYAHQFQTIVHESAHVAEMLLGFLQNNGHPLSRDLPDLLMDAVYRGFAYSLEALRFYGIGFGPERRLDRRILDLLDSSGPVAQSNLRGRGVGGNAASRQEAISRLYEEHLLTLTKEAELRRTTASEFFSKFATRNFLGKPLSDGVSTSDHWQSLAPLPENVFDSVPHSSP